MVHSVIYYVLIKANLIVNR